VLVRNADMKLSTHHSTKKILDDNPDLHKKWTSLIPVGKMGRPEDLMGAVVFLASDASLYVTGVSPSQYFLLGKITNIWAGRPSR